jgi:hypothetical protein
VEKIKTQIKVLDGIPSLETMVGMQRKALAKSLSLVAFTTISATALVFLLRHLSIGLSTPYSILELLAHPFIKLWSVVAA